MHKIFFENLAVIRTYSPPLKLAFILSVILHLCLCVILLNARQFPAPLQVFEVSLEPPEFSKANSTSPQIVSPSEKSEKKEAPVDTANRSEEDSSVVKEQIRRGDSRAHGAVGESSAAQKSVQSPQAQPAPANQTARASNPRPQTGKLNLALDQNIAQNIVDESLAKKQQTDSQNRFQNSPQNSAQSGNGARLFGKYGDSDFLPQVQDGEITLLNAKAAKFAVFVRRVATRVFHFVKEYGWTYVTRSDYQSLNDDAVVRAVLDPQGNLKTITFDGSSGSLSFDDVLSRSVKEGASDPHPPPGAEADDGNIHFIFMARSFSRMAPSQVGVAEQRWLMLKTGLE